MDKRLKYWLSERPAYRCDKVFATAIVIVHHIVVVELASTDNEIARIPEHVCQVNSNYLSRR